MTYYMCLCSKNHLEATFGLWGLRFEICPSLVLNYEYAQMWIITDRFILFFLVRVTWRQTSRKRLCRWETRLLNATGNPGEVFWKWGMEWCIILFQGNTKELKMGGEIKKRIECFGAVFRIPISTDPYHLAWSVSEDTDPDPGISAKNLPKPWKKNVLNTIYTKKNKIGWWLAGLF